MSRPVSSHPPGQGFFALLFSRPYLLLVLAPMFWGGNIVSGKLAVGNVDPFVLVVGRWAGAILIIVPLAWPHLSRDWKKIRPSLPLLALFGIFGFTGFNVLMYNSSLYTSAINGSIEQALIPVMVLLGNFLIFAVRPKLLQVLGLVLTIVGVILVATHGEPGRILALDVNIGDAMVLLACFFYASYSLALRFRPDVHWLSFLAVTSLFALVAAVLAQGFIGGGMARFFSLLPQITSRGWLIIIYVMSFPSILAQLFYARGVEIVGPNRASIFINLLPVFGTLLSVIIVGESFQLYHAAASVLVILGIILSEYSIRNTPAVKISGNKNA
ncbi:Permease of the drug/metabolite transporter (DMT) superfamily [hydrothermal vent metagenome]|uniref:Permease of the drug/metabolite transporter (DMT) superfamily n=1 Tax=hydrothermal vent metagenome TaxID=652676 RepID=A0A3B0UVF6_9ZZZZ